MSTKQIEIPVDAPEETLLSFLKKHIWAMPLAAIAMFGILMLLGLVGIVPRNVVNNVLEYVRALIPR
jgi:hypothetical protein